MLKIKQKILEYKYKKARTIYIVCFWADWAILPAKFANKFDKDGNPLTIQWTDHNGCYEEYYIAPWYHESTGAKQVFFSQDFARYYIEKEREYEKYKQNTIY